MTSMTTFPRRWGPGRDRRRATIDATHESATVERFYELMFAQDFEPVLNMVTDDVVLHVPWQLPGLPARAVGRDELRDIVMTWTAELWSVGLVTSIAVRPFASDHAWLAEVGGRLTARESGRGYRAEFVGEICFRDGGIASVKQYHNVLNQAIALGADVPGINVPGYGIGVLR
ncbi:MULTISPECIES: nuclear transport factor 2 family protein [unclassified Nocardia]|uniref:nuclear transport factor 2 family protein n=1 Tax=unclassified Nocardia TaxID=2637762 RepID=UPI001CE3CF8B|nr:MULTISPECIES: nuclear transport factor 2 family protein [unclassified Nocardia]